MQPLVALGPFQIVGDSEFFDENSNHDNKHGHGHGHGHGHKPDYENGADHSSGDRRERESSFKYFYFRHNGYCMAWHSGEL